MDGEVICPAKGLVRGHVHAYRIYPDGTPSVFPSLGRDVALDGRWIREHDVHNDVLYDWATIVSQLLRGSPDGKTYQISAMYLEYANSGAAPSGALSVSRDENLSYYASLASSGVLDYLRVPITASTLTSSDETLFPAGNVTTFFAQTQGTEGVHGKPCSVAAGSRFYGGALVATPSYNDPSQDLVFSRFYFASANQLDKLAGSQIGFSWPLTLQ